MHFHIAWLYFWVTSLVLLTLLGTVYRAFCHISGPKCEVSLLCIWGVKQHKAREQLFKCSLAFIFAELPMEIVDITFDQMIHVVMETIGFLLLFWWNTSCWQIWIELAIDVMGVYTRALLWGVTYACTHCMHGYEISLMCTNLENKDPPSILAVAVPPGFTKIIKVWVQTSWYHRWKISGTLQICEARLN